MGPAVPQLNRITSAGIVERAGTPQLKQLNMVNIEMFRHPKYYRELRKRALDERNSELHVRPISGSEASDTDQAISPTRATAPSRRATGPGPKLTRRERGIYKSTALTPGVKHQAASHKHQAPSSLSNKPQASSPEQQASSFKPQASSSKIL